VADVRLVVLGRSATRLPCPPGTTLGAVLAAAGVETAGRDVHVDGRPRALEESVRPGEIITVIPRVRGGMHLCTIEPEETASEGASSG
jgi:hypothetical protein